MNPPSNRINVPPNAPPPQQTLSFLIQIIPPAPGSNQETVIQILGNGQPKILPLTGMISPYPNQQVNIPLQLPFPNQNQGQMSNMQNQANMSSLPNPNPANSGFPPR